MTCETAQRAIALAALTNASSAAMPESGTYPGETRPDTRPGEDVWSAVAIGDLPNGERAALEAHLESCRACRADMTATVAFFRALGDDSGPEPSANLLARARMQLDETLDSSHKASFWVRFSQQISFTAGRLRAAPVLSSALLVLGIAAGAYGGYQAGSIAHTEQQQALLLAPPPPQVPSVVADVSNVRRDPATGMVEIQYDRLVSDMLTAPANDPSIRELLIAGAQTGVDANVRNHAVSLLAGAPCESSACGDSAQVRNALLNALVSDKSPEVRRAALAGLQPYIDRDMQVRDAILGRLLSDGSAEVRMQAVRLLEPVDVDSSVRQALHTVAAEDGDPSIRSASEAALRAMPQVQ